MMRATRNASVCIRSASRRDTAGSSSSCMVSASRPSAPTGLLSSWLMLATKSRRMASSRRRSVTSSITATAPTTAVAVVERHGADQQRPPGRAVQLEVLLGRSAPERGLEQLGDGDLGQRLAVAGAGEGLRDLVAEPHVRRARRRPPRPRRRRERASARRRPTRSASSARATAAACTRPTSAASASSETAAVRTRPCRTRPCRTQAPLTWTPVPRTRTPRARAHRRGSDGDGRQRCPEPPPGHGHDTRRPGDRDDRHRQCHHDECGQ